MADVPSEMLGNYVHSIYNAHREIINGIMLTSDVNIRYFTEANVSEAILLSVRSGWCYLFVDSRYYEEARREAMNCEVVLLKDRKKQLSEYFEKHNVTKLAIETDYVTLSEYQRLKEDFKNIEIVADDFVSREIKKIRLKKNKSEMSKIQKAQFISEDAVRQLVKNDIREGVSERYLAAKYSEYIARLGAEKTSFDTIVLFGENSSKPHGIPSNRTLKRGMNILIDCGAKYYGYCSDMTRNIFFGTPSEKYINVYNIVRGAQQRAIDKAVCTARLSDVDAAARDYIAENGYGENFGHATGHGVGMDIHEQPSIAPPRDLLKRTLQDGMVVTIEPGIYIPGKFGVRIEDLLVITEDKVYNLTNFSKELIVL